MAESSTDKRWSKQVTETSLVVVLEPRGVDLGRSATHRRIAAKLGQTKRLVQGAPLQSAMSMLNFYINRAGQNLPPERRIILEQAKDKLHKLYDRTEN